ncbi:flagellar motor switch protein FliN [bacterium]|nr:flagellar motor switch protein FliN [bacterium]MBU1598561.1 flagellar motor switch protein FliN [bacterium]MBU2462041.1 flagellar motor switch protein FliN [bacterium]
MDIQGSEGLGSGGILKEGLSQNIHPVQFATLKKEISDNPLKDLSLFSDVALDVRAELGKSKKRVRDILDIKKGSIIKLDRLVGEPVNIVINGRLIAKGGVVIVNENLGVRITEIIEPVYESLR